MTEADLGRIHIVLVRPAEPMNLGAVARAMRNCDLSRLTLVQPHTDDLVTARRVAVHAEDLLAAPRSVASLEEAVEDAVWIVGTTSRVIPGRPVLSPREVAAEAVARSRSGPVAVVFGGETSGLSNDDLVRCHAVSTIPSGRVQPSFNLAQAVLLYAYEVLEAARAGAPIAPEPERARDAEVAALEAPLRELLQRSGFADPDRPRHGVLDLLQMLRRASLTPSEARLWQAVLRAAIRALTRASPPGKP